MNPQFATTTAQHPISPDGRKSPGARRDWISFALRQMEPAVGGSIGLTTAWLAETSFPGLPVLWIFCVLAFVVGFWAWLRRPAEQIEMAARAVVLLAGAYVLHTHAGVPGGAGGVFFFWLGITSVYYALVLKPSWGSLIAVAAVLEFTLASLWSGLDTLSSLSAGSAFLLILPLLLVMKLGAPMRHPKQQADALIDSRTSIYNRTGLMVHGRLLLESCRREHREFTLAVFDCNDLREAREIYGTRTSGKLIGSIVKKLGQLAGDRGLAARTGPTQFAVALPMSRDRAVQAIERVLGNPSRFEIDSGNSEIVLVPNVMVETVSEAGTVERLFAALCRGLSRTHEDEQLRHRYLQRERERHSRPMPPQPAASVRIVSPARAPRLGPDPAAMHQIPPTMPLPLSMR